MSIKPIETYYNGYRFRSRSEARWTIVFDSLNIKYLYEPEGIVLPDGSCYLPDFYLPESETFFEVKGIMSEKDEAKIKQLSSMNVKVAIGYSDLSFQACNNFGNDYSDMAEKDESWLIWCRSCGRYSFMGCMGAWACPCCGYYDGDSGFVVRCCGDWTDSAFSFGAPEGDVLTAFTKARQARFEHGERGA